MFSSANEDYQKLDAPQMSHFDEILTEIWGLQHIQSSGLPASALKAISRLRAYKPQELGKKHRLPNSTLHGLVLQLSGLLFSKVFYIFRAVF